MNIRLDFTLPIFEIFQKSSISKKYKWLLKNEWISIDELNNIKLIRLNNLLIHAKEQVPLYSRILAEISLPIKDISALHSIPILTKDTIIKNFEQLKSTDIDNRKYALHSTGGSTGHPLKFIMDSESRSAMWASAFRGFGWAGYKLGDKIVTFSGSSLVRTQKFFSKQYFWEKFIMNNYKYSSINYNDEILFFYHKKLISLNPRTLRGYPSSLYIFAKFVIDNGLQIPKLKNVLTTGEVLLKNYRKEIENIFNAPLFDMYGAGDGGFNSLECEKRDGLHITEENCIVEIVDDDGKPIEDGKIGHVILTDLNNYSFPFIRYKVGDMAHIKHEKCECGRPTRRIGEVIGRAGRVLYSRNGDPISPTSLPMLLYPELNYNKKESIATYNKIDKFQIIQDEMGDLQILLKLKKANENRKQFNYIESNYEKHFPGSRVKIEYVDNISPLASGKEDYVISRYKK